MSQRLNHWVHWVAAVSSGAVVTSPFGKLCHKLEVLGHVAGVAAAEEGLGVDGHGWVQVGCT